jgi:hypothetical protein
VKVCVNEKLCRHHSKNTRPSGSCFETFLAHPNFHSCFHSCLHNWIKDISKIFSNINLTVSVSVNKGNIFYFLTTLHDYKLAMPCTCSEDRTWKIRGELRALTRRRTTQWLRSKRWSDEVLVKYICKPFFKYLSLQTHAVAAYVCQPWDNLLEMSTSYCQNNVTFAK